MAVFQPPPSLSRKRSETPPPPARFAREREAGLRGRRQMSSREHIRIVAVIQARMGSTRLPGKVLKPVAGQPLLWHIIHRLDRKSVVEDIAIATTVNPL